MRTFGICQGGNEEAFERWLDHVCGKFGVVRYVEFGVNCGATFKTVCDILKENKGERWLAYGFDPDPEALQGAQIRMGDVGTLFLNHSWEYGEVLNMDGVHFALVDACHGNRCVKRDFMILSSRMAIGGIIAFHDASVSCQGEGIQPHCGTGIDVRAALQELGLLENKLPGWKFLEESPGNWALAFFEFTGYAE